MNTRTFKRGIHPAGHKELAADSPIRLVHATGQAVYPLSQHIGAPAVAIVAPGERVLAGQKIAEAGGFVSAPIYSAVSGTVGAIGPHMNASGETVPCITIDTDGLDQWVNPAWDPAGEGAYAGEAVETLVRNTPEEALTPTAIRGAVREAGIVGLGGAGFPAAVKLTPKDPEAIDYLIINGAECEPYLTCDYRLMLERAEALLAGCRWILRLFPKARCVLAVEDNKPDAILHLTELVKASGDGRLSVCPLRAKYPQGGERMLIAAVTGRRLNASLLPADKGCIVMNVSSVIASFFAIACGRPLTHRIMTVTGDSVATPCNLEVPVGMSYRAVLEAAGGYAKQPKKVITGGPMMGTALFSLDIPVTKTSASILALSEDPVAIHDTTPCVHCGKCLRACPERLVPQLLSAAADRDEFDTFEKYGGMECIECGSCAYVCPAKRHLVQSMRYGKRKTGEIIRARRAKEAAETAKGGTVAGGKGGKTP